jgi:hypothetical protein
MLKIEERHLNLLAALKPYVGSSKQNLIDISLGVFSFANKQEGARINPEAAMDLVQVLNTQIEHRRLSQAKLPAAQAERGEMDGEHRL